MLAHGTKTFGSIDIHYVEAGPQDGPLVVFLHGFPEFWYSWRHQLQPLADAGFHVVAPDLRGYGDSSKPREASAYRIPEIVKDVAALIRSFTSEACMLVGHDWGGVAAWFLPMLHSDLVSKLVVMNSPHPVPFARTLKRSTRQKLKMSYQLFMQLPVIPELLLPRVLPKLARRMARFTDEDLEQYRESWRKPGAIRGMVNYYRAMRTSRGDLRAMVKRIDVPTMLVWGERDPVFLHATTENFGEWVPDLRVERIARAGHFVQTDAADEVTSLLLDFLATAAPSSETR